MPKGLLLRADSDKEDDDDDVYSGGNNHIRIHIPVCKISFIMLILFLII